MNDRKRDKYLAKAIEDLPDFSPAENLWEEISKGLDEKSQAAKKDRFNFRRLAAAVILLISLPLIVQYLLQNQKEQVRFGEELNEFVSSGALNQAEDGFVEFLSEECSEYRQICEMPEFKLLMTQLTEIRAEVVDIDQMIESTGFDEMLYKAKSKAGKESDRIKKEIVKLLRG